MQERLRPTSFQLMNKYLINVQEVKKKMALRDSDGVDDGKRGCRHEQYMRFK
jgi:hypothetical protein